MTVVCCWLDQSYGRTRITAIADAQASIKVDDEWRRLNTGTTKLYRVAVNCYNLAALDCANGAWIDPYFSTEIGFAFSGNCFEAMSILALYRRCLEQLVATNGGSERPEPDKLALLLVEIANRWYSDSDCDPKSVATFILCGFSPTDGQPWAATIYSDKISGARLEAYSHPLDELSVYSIGDVGKSKTLTANLEAIRRRILRHADGLVRPTGDVDKAFLHDLEVARHHSADKKIVEDLVLAEMEKEFNRTVGGTLQKIEVHRCDDNRAVVAYCRNTVASRGGKDGLLDGLPEVANGLGYLPTTETMGGIAPR